MNCCMLLRRRIRPNYKCGSYRQHVGLGGKGIGFRGLTGTQRQSFELHLLSQMVETELISCGVFMTVLNGPTVTWNVLELRPGVNDAPS